MFAPVNSNLARAITDHAALGVIHGKAIMPRITRRSFVTTGLAALSTPALADTTNTSKPDGKTYLRRIRTQYIATLAKPEEKSGTGAENWGWWYIDPGPRGVWLHQYDQLIAAGGVARMGWHFDKNDWWLDENGILMEKPVFNIRPGRFVVTGGREAVSILTIHPRDENGVMRWELSKDATIDDVTHRECRAARYRPQQASQKECSPANATRKMLKIHPGEPMPDMPGCSKQDYIVLFVIGLVVEKSKT